MNPARLRNRMFPILQKCTPIPNPLPPLQIIIFSLTPTGQGNYPDFYGNYFLTFLSDFSTYVQFCLFFNCT